MMGLSIINIFFMVPGVVSMGIGLGAAYPDFKSENPAQTVTSFGGLVFMISCAGYIGAVIIIQAGPVYNLFMAGIKETRLSGFTWIWIIGSFVMAFIINIFAILLPMKFGEKKLSQILI
jgi:ABC-2 type transport system permease protein